MLKLFAYQFPLFCHRVGKIELLQEGVQAEPGTGAAWEGGDMVEILCLAATEKGWLGQAVSAFFNGWVQLLTGTKAGVAAGGIVSGNRAVKTAGVQHGQEGYVCSHGRVGALPG